MKCPECCTELVLKDFSDIGVELDVCNACNGLWFDPGKLLKSIKKIEDKTFDPPHVFTSESKSCAQKRPWRPCPCCSKSMNTISQKSVEIDFCKSCKGFWFDAGEVVAIARQFRRGRNKKHIELLIKSYKESLKFKNKKVRKSKREEYVSTYNLDEVNVSPVDLANAFCDIAELGVETGRFIAEVFIEIITS